MPAPNLSVPIINNVPVIPFDVVPNFFKITPDQNFGETLAVAVNSKGNVVVLNHPGTATSGPLYGNATTQIWEFDSNGKFLREIGKGVYGLGYAHSVRFDKYDNLWVVDKGTNSVMKFNPAGYVTMNLGRRMEGYEGEYHRVVGAQARPSDGNYNAPTDVGWDAEDNIYISDGYGNSRVAKLNKNGDWIKAWGTFGTGEGQFRVPHNLQVDKQGNVYVADRSNGRIQVFDSERHVQEDDLVERGLRQEPPSGAGQYAGEPAQRDGPVGAVHHDLGSDAVSLCRRHRARTPLQDDARRPDSRDARRVGSRTEAVQLAARHRVSVGRRHLHCRHEQLARAEADAPTHGQADEPALAALYRPRSARTRAERGRHLVHHVRLEADLRAR